MSHLRALLLVIPMLVACAVAPAPRADVTELDALGAVLTADQGPVLVVARRPAKGFGDAQGGGGRGDVAAWLGVSSTAPDAPTDGQALTYDSASGRLVWATPESGAATLQEVTDEGATTTDEITVGGLVTPSVSNAGSIDITATGGRVQIAGDEAGDPITISNPGGIELGDHTFPDADNALDLGSASVGWRTVYADTSVRTPAVSGGSGAVAITGTGDGVSLTATPGGNATIGAANGAVNISAAGGDGAIAIDASQGISVTAANGGLALESTGGTTITGGLTVDGVAIVDSGTFLSVADPIHAPNLTAQVQDTLTGSWVSNAEYTWNAWRVGNTVYADVTILLHGAPTSASLTLTLPASVGTIDETPPGMMGGATRHTYVGTGIAFDSSAASTRSIMAIYAGGVDNLVYVQNIISAGSNTPVTQAAPFAFANADYIQLSLKFQVE